MAFRIIALALLPVIAGIGASARAADMKVYPLQNTPAVAIAVSGQFDLSDGKQFAAIAARYPRAVVVFSSPGGAMIAGLQIGQIIRLRHYPTLVLQGMFCASSCALAWLAGTPRLLQAGGRVGFHAVFIEHDGDKEETGVGNALVGAYLNNLGLSTDAIIFIEQAHPNEITWITASDANRHDIAFQALPAAPDDSPAPASRDVPQSPRPSSPQPPIRRDAPHPFSVLTPALSAPAAPVQQARPLEERARLFARDYFAHWSEDNGEALAYFGSSYAQTVSFYGKQADRAAVLQGKRDFAERWPVRVYSIRPNELKSFCNDATQTCTVSGIVDWDCRNTQRRAHSVGSANFVITAVMSGDHGQVLAETGSVISRNTD